MWGNGYPRQPSIAAHSQGCRVGDGTGELDLERFLDKSHGRPRFGSRVRGASAAWELRLGFGGFGAVCQWRLVAVKRL